MNIFGSAWQGGVLSKLKGFRLALGYLPRLLSGDKSLTHTQMDMAIALILRYGILRQIIGLDRLLKVSEEALTAAQNHSKEPQEIALAYIRIALVHIYSGNKPDAMQRMIQAKALINQIQNSGKLNQLASVLRHLGDMQSMLKEFGPAKGYYRDALSIALSVSATDQIRKINNQLRRLERITVRRRAF